jgi:hypothetical protein
MLTLANCNTWNVKRPQLLVQCVLQGAGGHSTWIALYGTAMIQVPLVCVELTQAAKVECGYAL